MTRAYATSSLAKVEQDAASATMREIDQNNIQLHALIYEIGALGQQVDAARARAAGYDKYDPKAAHDAITTAIADAQGGPDKPDWFKNGDNSSPSLATVKQSISQLQGQIAKQSDDLKALQDQRAQVLEEADQADKSSELAKGQQSVDEFKRAANLRKQAGNLSVQIEKNQAQTVPLQQDMAVAQGRQGILEELIKQFQDQSDALDAGWKSLQQTVASQSELQKQIVGTAGDNAPDAATDSKSILPATAGKSINAKAEALGKLVEEIGKQRSDALANLNNAIQHYRDAGSAAQTYFATLDPKIKDPANSLRPELVAWKSLQEVTSPAVHRMQEALAERQLAELYVSAVTSDNSRAQLQEEISKTLAAANLPIPPALSDASLDEDKKSAAASASDAYDKADKEITNLTNGAAPPLIKSLARVQHILTLYGQVQLARAMGDASTAQDKLTQTTTEVGDVSRDGLQLPTLPAEIVPPPAAPGATPPPA